MLISFAVTVTFVFAYADCWFSDAAAQISFSNSDYRKRWRDVISQHPGHSHGYKSVMAALLKANTRYILFAQMTQNAKIFKSFVV